MRERKESVSTLPTEPIDTYLAAETSANLISRIFDLCATYVEKGSASGAAASTLGPKSVLGRVLSALYASRHGLSDDEIWGIVELATGNELSMEHREALRRILKDQTMIVNGLRSFSHEDYAGVVYVKYIQEPAANVKIHQLMARYFGRLEVGDRDAPVRTAAAASHPPDLGGREGAH